MKKKLIGSVVIIIVVAVILAIILFQKFTPESSGTGTGTVLQEICGIYYRPIDDWHAPDELTLKENGNFTLTTMAATVSGKYKIEGDKITLYELRLATIYGSSILEGVVKGKIENNQITIHSDDCPAAWESTFGGTWKKAEG